MQLTWPDANVGERPVTWPGHGGLGVVACSDAMSGRARLDARLLQISPTGRNRAEASCRGGRSACGWSSSGEGGGVLLADGSWRGKGAGQQVADLVARGAGVRIAERGVPVLVDSQQTGTGLVPGH